MSHFLQNRYRTPPSPAAIMALTSTFPPPHVIVPTTPHTHTVNALHGRGSNGQEFAEELFENKTSSGMTMRGCFPGWKWVFPSSRRGYSTVFQEELQEWFDIYSLTEPSKREDLQKEGLRHSVTFLRHVIEQEAQLVGGFDKIILLGLSMGCATGLLTMLAGTRDLGAFVGLNGWMPCKEQIQQSTKTADARASLAAFFASTLGFTTGKTESGLATPIYLGHMTDDEVVDVELGRQARVVLEDMGMTINWKEREVGGHLGFLEKVGLDDIVGFLEKMLVD